MINIEEPEIGKGGCVMKRWYLWFVLAGIQVIGGIINYFDGGQIIAPVIAAGIFGFMGITQFICERNGEKGRKVFRYISIGVLIALVVVILCLLPVMIDILGKIM